MDALKDLPDLSSHGHHFIDTITSQLGHRNPFSHPADPATTIVWLFDNTAYHAGADTSKYWAEFTSAFFVQRSGAEASMAVAQLARAIGLADDELAKKTISRRLMPLLNQILPAKTVSIKVQGGQQVQIGPSGPSGISKDVVGLPEQDYKDGQVLNTNVEGGFDFVGAGTTIASAEGWAVISDIDDTIKKTLTNSPLGILKTTFAEEAEPIDGMPDFYKHMNERLGNPPFWYLSASPYNLYPFLRQFRNEHYPHGTLLLRDASWMNLAGFISSLSVGTQKYKVENMDMLHEWWPKRKMVCIGDSTQSDPEAYGEAYRKYGGWIRAIFIRRVQDVVEVSDIFPGQDSESRNKPDRFIKAFKDVPSTIWHVFDEPSELYDRLLSLTS